MWLPLVTLSSSANITMNSSFQLQVDILYSDNLIINQLIQVFVCGHLLVPVLVQFSGRGETN